LSERGRGWVCACSTLPKNMVCHRVSGCEISMSLQVRLPNHHYHKI